MRVRDLEPCPNCETADVCVADRTNHVICRKCKMTGPVGRWEEEAVLLWNRLPRRTAPDFEIIPDVVPDSLKGDL